jgi:hypothetical protein
MVGRAAGGGNEAAHGVGTTVSKQDARDLLDFTTAIIDYLFSYRDQFEKFRTRRKGKSLSRNEEKQAVTHPRPY